MPMVKTRTSSEFVSRESSLELARWSSYPRKTLPRLRSERSDCHPHDPLVIGVDVARYGANETVIFFRKGRDARSIQPVRLRGASVVQVAAKVSEVCSTHHVDAVFVDGGGVGGGVVDNLRALHVHCFDIQFGSKAEAMGFAWGTEGERYANKRAEIWGSMRIVVEVGEPFLTNQTLLAQLVGPTYTYNLKNEILLEKKEEMMKRGLDSPDLADALALTFSMPVQKHAYAGSDQSAEAIGRI